MNKLFFLLLLLAAAVLPAFGQAPPPPAGKAFVLYAQFIEDTKVDLSDGSVWAMDKGDCFPVYMFKERQTKVVLQLGAATFMTETKRMRIMKDAEMEVALQSYRKNLENFLKSKTDRWKKENAAPAKS